MQLRDRYEIHSSPANVAAALAVTLFAALLTSCGSSDTPQVAAPVAPVKREKVPDDPTAKMARAVQIGTATSPVTVKYEVLNKPVVGLPVEIELAVVPAVGADSMTIAFAGSPGLVLSADAAPPIDVVKIGQIERAKFSAQAQQESVFYVTVTATLYTAGTSTARTFAIPLIMSAPSAPATPEAAPPKKS